MLREIERELSHNTFQKIKVDQSVLKAGKRYFSIPWPHTHYQFTVSVKSTNGFYHGHWKAMVMKVFGKYILLMAIPMFQQEINV